MDGLAAASALPNKNRLAINFEPVERDLPWHAEALAKVASALPNRIA